MNLRTYDSFRLYFLVLHLISTCFLIWTRYPSVQVTMKAQYSSEDYHFAEDSYLGLLAFGIMFLTVQILVSPLHIGKLSFRRAFATGCDIAAIFFNFWIALDGLGWDTYIYIFVFCVLIPSLFEAMFIFPLIFSAIAAMLSEVFEGFHIVGEFCRESYDDACGFCGRLYDYILSWFY